MTGGVSFNTFGHVFRFTTWGESHGPAIGAVVDGCPPGLALSEADVQPWLDRRRPGTSRFTTQRQEPDAVRILSGVYRGRTTGTPIHLMIDNVDQRSKDYGDIAQAYRPGHADYAYDAKYGLRDPRGGGRASARETASRVAAGAVARLVIPEVGIRAYLVELGGDAGRPQRLRRRRDRPQPVLLPRRRRCRAVGGGARRGAERRVVARRGRRMRRDRGPGRVGQPGLRQARQPAGVGDA